MNKRLAKEEMASRDDSKQCLLVKGNKSQVSWMPIIFAVAGRVLKLKGDNGWVVKEVWG